MIYLLVGLILGIVIGVVSHKAYLRYKDFAEYNERMEKW